ncbi:hypothetical protein CC80DRAFT_489519 [Byssothecium circinans]|uniref:Uncharacterized protein n=1 Tax=Byssothecium circinans TaxID=147558 RepID=A0A6A5UGX3_9PLEO|nr:hypothetical protein CC80DRAFT_489519 [Byssothecium circinans]
MSSGPNSSSSRGKKRSFSMYSLKQGLIHFEAHGAHFAIHHELIIKYCTNETLEEDFNHNFDIFPGNCRHCPHMFKDVFGSDFPECALRGLIHWLYHQELPTDDDIKSLEYPKEWNNGDEKEPLACSMAMELYHLAQRNMFPKLMEDAMTFLFLRYKQQRIVPSMGRVNRIFQLGKSNGFPHYMEQFTADLYYKWCAEIPEDIYALELWDEKDSEDHPKMFLYLLFKRKCLANKKNANKRQESPLVLRLFNYIDPDYTTHDDRSCGCRGLSTGDEHVIA